MHTKGKADETNKTPAYFKIGASDIDPTSAGTSITTSTTMTIASHNGKYIYVVYTEDGITKWASYQITVNPAAPTEIVLSSYAETIAIDETFSFTDISVTINPSAYATQVSPLINIIGENTNTVAIIVIISMVSVTAIGGYFFLRKRKENI